MHESKSESEGAQSCLTLHDPMDCSPAGSSIHGIFQARVLEWGAIAFSYTNVNFVTFQREIQYVMLNYRYLLIQRTLELLCYTIRNTSLTEEKV